MWVHAHSMTTGEEIDVGRTPRAVHSVSSRGRKSYSSGSEDGTIRIWKTFPEGPVPAE